MRSATAESAADADGVPIYAPMARIYGDLARGGVGLIVTGHLFVHPSGRAAPAQAGLATDAQAHAWEGLLELIRRESPAPVLAQLAFAGRQAYAAGRLTGGNDPRERFPVPGTAFVDYHERQIENVIGAFADAAARAAKVGFDGVQVHMAHGYLLSEVLSFHTNRRADGWGGDDADARRRMPLEVVRRVREAAGPELAVAVKLNGSDYLPPDGVGPSEASQTARALAGAGVELIEVSAGMAESGLKAAQPVHGPEDEAFLRPLADEVARAVDVAVATVGGYRTTPVMLDALAGGLDMVSLSRPLIRESDLPRKIERDPSHRAACISCNACFRLGRGALRCMIDHPEPLE
jgi:2,4-dienoyl-CoA reductase-like NADH-dependent reductase (Old Yellow Enzyme family)